MIWHIDVEEGVNHAHEVEADSRKQAEERLEEMLNRRNFINPAHVTDKTILTIDYYPES